MIQIMIKWQPADAEKGLVDTATLYSSLYSEMNSNRYPDSRAVISKQVAIHFTSQVTAGYCYCNPSSSTTVADRQIRYRYRTMNSTDINHRS